MLKHYKFIILLVLSYAFFQAKAQTKPNVVIIYCDDLGYGDISCNGATKISTPNIDKIAAQGIRFTNSHATSSTCTPSRYGLLTGQYPWRKKGTGIAEGSAGSIINEDQFTLADVFKQAGYKTAVVGKWHLGLGGQNGPEWNGNIKPSPNDLGFDYSFIIPATPDRVPCVYVENHHVANLDPNDPLKVSYKTPLPGLPTGKEHPELLKMMYSSKQHAETIINGISRIGYMSGGKSAWWKDELMADKITGQASEFIKNNYKSPFFLYFAIQDIHVPRVPNPRFVGKSGLGARGDAILELDYNTGKILNLLDSLNISENTLVVFSSDNGPVLDDGYQDDAVEKLNGHTPGGPLRGGKYSKFDAGTRVPTLIKWPAQIKSKQTSAALFSQLDFFASFANLTQQKIPLNTAPDSRDMLNVLLGKSKKGRESLVEQGLFNGLSLISGNWKYIAPSKGPAVMKDKNIETGVSETPQLYNLKEDIGETKNLAAQYPDKVKEMATALEDIEGTHPQKKIK
ncbi:arylsulfatase [Pedobacter sp. SD-b]|uniref:Arylsulfatase n=1 Tax=Pedobacter segetis TaxID=2793069 RepID=A0ABS1BM85_9SPHI|nr:arylsulfatase [Pedobacter segetis]MBK0383892.1 arylsulfatase [Pedobacter segetis]